MTVYDLGDISLIVDRPDASPAPTAGPGDPPIPTGPWAPTVDELSTRAQRTVADLWAAIDQSQRARGAAVELREVA